MSLLNERSCVFVTTPMSQSLMPNHQTSSGKKEEERAGPRRVGAAFMLPCLLPTRLQSRKRGRVKPESSGHLDAVEDSLHREPAFPERFPARRALALAAQIPSVGSNEVPALLHTRGLHGLGVPEPPPPAPPQLARPRRRPAQAFGGPPNAVGRGARPAAKAPQAAGVIPQRSASGVLGGDRPF
jgi:hypothetical protein